MMNKVRKVTLSKTFNEKEDTWKVLQVTNSLNPGVGDVLNKSEVMALIHDRRTQVVIK